MNVVMLPSITYDGPSPRNNNTISRSQPNTDTKYSLLPNNNDITDEYRIKLHSTEARFKKL